MIPLRERYCCVSIAFEPLLLSCTATIGLDWRCFLVRNPPGDDGKEIPTVKLPSVPHVIRIEINVAAKHSPEELQKLRRLMNGACHSSAVEIVAGVRVGAKTLS